MTIEEYFGEWMKVIDRKETLKLVKWLSSFDRSTLCPHIKDVFKAFRLCSYKDCKVVFIGQDPYNQKDVATGILFGNKRDTPEDRLSPSLQVIKESVIDLEVPHNCINFDLSLENWAMQGVLMLNSALTTETGKAGVHSLKWRIFMIALLNRLSMLNPGLIYVLFGSQAKMLKPFIGKNNTVFTIEHPSWYARTHNRMPSSFWKNINSKCKELFGTTIEWYTELI